MFDYFVLKFLKLSTLNLSHCDRPNCNGHTYDTSLGSTLFIDSKIHSFSPVISPKMAYISQLMLSWNHYGPIGGVVFFLGVCVNWFILNHTIIASGELHAFVVITYY